MVDISTKIQSEIRAGVTLKFLQVIAHYPAPDWVATTTISSARQRYSVTATASGKNHLFHAGAATTSDYVPGAYRLLITVSDGIDVYIVESRDIEVRANMMAGIVDDRSQTKRILDAIRNQIEGRASKEEAAYAIAGRSLSYMGIDELIKFKNHYEYLYQQEKKAEKINLGQSVGKNILIRME